MCVVSAVGDNYEGLFPNRHPDWTDPTRTYPILPATVTPQEFNALKKEVEELKTLLKAAKKFDENTGQPNCEVDSKVEFIKKLAELLNVDISDVF